MSEVDRADVEAVVKRLAEVQDELLSLDSDDFATRYRLESERDRLRDQAAEFSGAVDAGRPTHEIERELASLRSQLEAIEASKIDMVMQSGGGTNAGAGADGMGGVVLNQQIGAASGIDKIRSRIAQLETVLHDRSDMDAGTD